MKRFICSALAAMMLFTSAAYADTNANVFIGDTLVEYTDQEPVIINERTYVPIRDVFEALGFEVDWNDESKTVSISNNYYYIMLFTNSNTMFTLDSGLDYKYTKLENPVQIVNDRTLLPLREILENVNYSIEWDADSKSSIVSDSNDYTALDKKQEQLKELMDYDFGTFEYDPTKPEGELTQEEYDFLFNLFTVIHELSEESDTIFDIEGYSEQELAEISALVEKYTAKFSDVPCPDSLKGMDEKFKALFTNAITNISDMNAIISDNSDDDSLGFAVTMIFMAKFEQDFIDAVKPMGQLAKERNIDLESIFGDLIGDNNMLF